MLKFLSKRFCEYCPKFIEKNVKTEFYVTRRFSCGIFFPEKTTRLFVIPGLRTKSFRTFTKRFSTIVKFSVYVSTDMFCGKKHCFISTGFWAKIFWLPSKNIKMVFETASCVFRGRFLGKLFIVLKNKKNFLIFFLVFLRKLIGRPVKTAF